MEVQDDEFDEEFENSADDNWGDVDITMNEDDGILNHSFNQVAADPFRSFRSQSYITCWKCIKCNAINKLDICINNYNGQCYCCNVTNVTQINYKKLFQSIDYLIPNEPVFETSDGIQPSLQSLIYASTRISLPSVIMDLIHDYQQNIVLLTFLSWIEGHSHHCRYTSKDQYTCKYSILKPYSAKSRDMRLCPLLKEKLGRFTFERDPDNDNDKNAIRVLTADGEHVGFLRKYDAASIAPLIDANVLGISTVMAKGSLKIQIDTTQHVAQQMLHGVYKIKFLLNPKDSKLFVHRVGTIYGKDLLANSYS